MRVRLTGEACEDLPVTPAIAMESSEGVAAQKVAGDQCSRSEATASSNSVRTWSAIRTLTGAFFR
ncbi:hypothetical protein TM49_17330 [Martelella endophytica]|uniref:Uncharacterized protein n=1 Tax=Martelella endophytica TaxID=1486262 RepID=A0A0D5LS68_MAREN|nr:hypothetical protein TM49_17330 [Martelella endophytica]